MSRTRVWITILLIGATAALTRAARLDPGTAPGHLASLPYRLQAWTGRDAAPLDLETARALGADAYLLRRYTAASAAPVDLYVAYYSRQQPGVSIHSPLHCLPGTGWELLDVGALEVHDAGGGLARMRRLIVRKGLARAMVLYWYAIHGRMIDQELTSKLWLLHDSVRLGRSDAALIRIVVPLRDETEDGLAVAERQGAAFANAVAPFMASLGS